MARPKYGNRKVIIDGIAFDSKKEGNRYCELKLLQRAGSIVGLTLQPEFELQPAYTVNGKRVRAITYRADFKYFDTEKNRYVVEDVKGFRTKEYLLKKKMFAYKFGFEITEV